jgi:predicted GNAT family N-acyltransferase
MDVVLKQPESAEEFKSYFNLRYRILRAPWGEPAGSEIDEMENQCFHIMAMDNQKTIAVGRLQYNSAYEAQIRYMAVEKAYEGNGIGRMIVNTLEQQARDKNMCAVILDAREPAVGFYQTLGYKIEKKSYLLFDKIQHYRMTKQI